MTPRGRRKARCDPHNLLSGAMLTPARLPRALRIAAYLVCLAVLLWLELAPTEALPAPNISDKLEHVIAYAVLTAPARAFVRP